MFANIYVRERELAGSLFIQEKYGAESPSLVEDEPISKTVERNRDELKEAYIEAKMYHGEAAFEEQIKRIKNSITQAIGLSKQ